MFHDFSILIDWGTLPVVDASLHANLTAQQMEADEADELLMLAYGRGDAAAFDHLYKRHKGPLYRYCLRNTSQAAFADEVFQDIWTTIIRKRREYIVAAKFKTWLYKIAHSRIVDFYRRNNHHVSLRKDYDPDAEGQAETPAAIERVLQPEALLERREFNEQMRRFLAALPPLQRDALLLKEEAGLSLQEIADICGTSRETVKSRLRYGINTLRRLWKESS